MATNAGVWMDHKQAIVVLVTDAGSETKKIKSGLEHAKRPAGTRIKGTAYTPNDFVPEDRRERKIKDEQKKFYDDVLALIRGAKVVLLLGPGEAKGEFGKHIKAKKVRGIAVASETTDKMTERQIVAKVEQQFSTVSGTKSAAPKKAAKKVAKPAAGKRTKKSGR